MIVTPRVCSCSAVFLTLLACSMPLSAAEPVAEFLEALRGARYYDTAAEYLARMADSPDVDE